MGEFIDNRTFCNRCYKKVVVGQLHECKKGDDYVPTQNYYCAYCQTYISIITINGYSACSNCKKILHGGISHPDETGVHLVPPSRNYANYNPRNYANYNGGYVFFNQMFLG